MADFLVPELGENIATGDVVRILVKPGDVAGEEQPVLELETDKATIEVPSSVAGVVTEVKVNEGEKIKVGQVVLTVDEPASAAGAARRPSPPRRRSAGQGGASRRSGGSGRHGRESAAAAATAEQAE